MRRTRRCALLMASAVALVVPACGDDEGGGGSGGLGTIEAALGQLPPGDERPGMVISWADLDAVTEALGATRPDGSSWDEVAAWGYEVLLDVDSPIGLVPPEPFGVRQARSPEDFAEEHGWSIADVDAFIELVQPVGAFVASGDLGIDEDLTVEVADGIRGTREGEGTLMAERDGLLIAARQREPLEGWVGDGPRLDEDEGLRSVARALDDRRAISAALVRREPLELDWAYDTAGIGWAVDGGEPRTVIAFRVLDDAEDAADALERALEGAEVLGQPFASLLDLEDVDTDDDVVVLTFSLGPEGTGQTALQLWSRHAFPFAAA